MNSLKNKIAIITGGGRGIGWGISRLFAREGATVVMASPEGDVMEKAVQAIEQEGGRAISVVTDISKPDDVQRLIDLTVDQFGRIDILIANAGINPGSAFLDIPLEEWNAVIDVNLTGTFLCMQRAGRVMAKNGGGRIVMITSVDGQIVVPGEGHYGASKAALMHLCRIAAVELIQYGIYVNSIAPGWVYTDLTKHELDIPEKREYWQSNIPAHRVATIDEIAQAALFLARDDLSQFIVGASLVMDGGASLVMKGF